MNVPGQSGGNSRELDQLCRFAATLGTTLDVRTLVEDSLEPLMSMAEASRALIALSGADVRTLEAVDVSGWTLPGVEKGIPASPVASLGTEARYFDSVADLPRQMETRLEDVGGPVAVIPLWAHAHLRGVVILQRSDKAPFTTPTLKLLTAAGRQFALAVENSQLLSDLQHSYQKLMDTQEELIRSERLAALGQLSATMAHEIRNPLATIFSAISQIRRLSGDEETRATLLNIAEEEAGRLNAMVSGLLEFARPRTPSFETGRPADVALQAVTMLREKDQVTEGVDIEIVEEDKDVLLQMDFDLMHRALSLLITNAIHASQKNGGMICVFIAKGAKEGSAVIEIRDQGEGIPRELVSKVLEPFFSTKPTGTGLGLPTARRIVEDHRGRLEIETQVGTGTTIRLLLPGEVKTAQMEEKNQ